tara:strand:+ start:28 stop:540 length:513 start_codon:yes stop_codon:yes gene_type:complete
MEDFTTRLARAYATGAHAAIGQLRKYSADPYIVHPIRVAGTVEAFGGNLDMISAAYLHDVVEDTQVTRLDIYHMFGPIVGRIVEDLTDVSTPGKNRAERKAKDRAHSASASYEAQFVKCADIIDNASDIGDHDPSFNVVYRLEMFRLLEVLDKVKDTLIYEAAINAVTLK